MPDVASIKVRSFAGMARRSRKSVIVYPLGVIAHRAGADAIGRARRGKSRGFLDLRRVAAISGWPGVTDGIPGHVQVVTVGLPVSAVSQ
jgi:hypothetical protein